MKATVIIKGKIATSTWNFTSKAVMLGEVMSQYGRFKDANQITLEWVQGCYNHYYKMAQGMTWAECADYIESRLNNITVSVKS